MLVLHGFAWYRPRGSGRTSACAQCTVRKGWCVCGFLRSFSRLQHDRCLAHLPLCSSTWNT